MIDKVVRMRTKEGKFGVDHSEILNYEFEMANKARDDHMNYLVYKTAMQSQRDITQYNDIWDKENTAHLMTSDALFTKLNNDKV
jgi:hypothetical protein